MDCKFSTASKHAFQGNTVKLKETLKKNPNLIRTCDHLSRQLLHYSALGGQISTLKFLIGKNCNIDCQDSFRRTPLHYAAQKGKLEIVEILLSKKCNVELQDVNGITSLHLACRWPNCLNIILKTWSFVDLADRNERTALHWSAYYGEVKSMDLLMRHGATVEKLDVDRKSPLHWSICSTGPEAVKCVQLILKQSPDMLNGQDHHGRTSLHWAVSDGNSDLVELLCHAPGIELDRADNAFLTPLHWAAQLGDKKKIQILLSAGANHQICDKNSYTPIFYAVAHNHMDAVKCLLMENKSSPDKLAELIKFASDHNVEEVFFYFNNLSSKLLNFTCIN